MLSEKKPPVNLRTVAERVGLAPCSVSAILNNTPASKVIPQSTKDRVFRAATELNYRPNLWARSLRTKRTRMVAAVAPDFGRAPVARIVAGLQKRLQKKGYLLALGTADLSDSNQPYSNQNSAQFQPRGIEGVVAIDSSIPRQMELPVASVEVGYLTASEALTEETHSWLTGLGEKAAETIVQQIEGESTSRRMTVDVKMPTPFFGIPLGAGVAARESA